MTRHVWLPVRAGALATVTTGSVTLATRFTGGAVLELAHAAGAPDTARVWTLDHLVGDLACALLLVTATGLGIVWGVAMTAALAVERAPTLAAACSRVSPPMCRRLVAAVLGLGLVAPVMVGGSALADARGHDAVEGVGCRPGSRLAGLELPDLPSTKVGAARQAAPPRQVVVHEGDSLWRIAHERLPPRASAGEVAALTWRLYSLNRSAIGDDPDLIYPGTRLDPPEGSSWPSR